MLARRFPDWKFHLALAVLVVSLCVGAPAGLALFYGHFLPTGLAFDRDGAATQGARP